MGLRVTTRKNPVNAFTGFYAQSTQYLKISNENEDLRKNLWVSIFGISRQTHRSLSHPFQELSPNPSSTGKTHLLNLLIYFKVQLLERASEKNVRSSPGATSWMRFEKEKSLWHFSSIHSRSQIRYGMNCSRDVCMVWYVQ